MRGVQRVLPGVGMAQALSSAGADSLKFMAAGRWDSLTMLAKYTESQPVGRGAVVKYYLADLRD